MPATGPVHANPIAGGVDLHERSPAVSPDPQTSAVASSRQAVSSGPLAGLTSHSARAPGTPRVSTNPFDTPRVSTNPFDTPRLVPPSFEAAGGVRLSPLRIPSRETVAEEAASPASARRANTPAAFARLRNRHGQDTSAEGPHMPHVGSPSPRDEAAPVDRLAGQHGDTQNIARGLADETMGSTEQFTSPMIQAQIFAAESQMLISMVSAQVDVAKAAASAVADAARKS